MSTYFSLLFKRAFSFKKMFLVITLFSITPMVKAIYLFYNANLPLYKIERFERTLMTNMFISIIIPVSTAIFIVGIIRSEIDTGTISYLFTVPHSRRWLPITFLVIALTILIPIILFTGLLANSGKEISLNLQDLMKIGTLSIASSFAYISIWMAISLFFKRALMIVMIYCFVWEATLSKLSGGVKKISISFYANRIFVAFNNASTLQHVITLLIIGAIAILIATFKISRMET